MSLRERLNPFSSTDGPEDAFMEWNDRRPEFEDADGLDTEELAHLLSNKRRNLAVAVMSIDGSDTATPIRSYEELADAVAGNEIFREKDIDVNSITVDSDDVRRVARSLRETHIPQLAEYGILEEQVIESDGEEYTFIRRGPNFDAAYYALNDLAGYAEVDNSDGD